ncbi:hypothetical protein [Pseudomonas yamanorum]|uniref:hypothetical protein n=1 Tax=Pseudomonas yamanorum TaxID=515393 RepID=UPI003D35CC06
MHQSPYEQHRDILLNGMYGTAYRLQEFVLYQLDPCRYTFDIDEHRGGFDSVHLQIYQDMKQWYWENGPSSAGFKDVAEALQDRYTRQAQENLEELYLLRAMQPSDFPTEPGEIPADSHKHAVERTELFHREYVGKGFINE